MVHLCIKPTKMRLCIIHFGQRLQLPPLEVILYLILLRSFLQILPLVIRSPLQEPQNSY